MDKLTPNEKIVWSCWEGKTQRDVVREAANKGTLIPLCLQFLVIKNDWSEDIAKKWFYAEVKAWTVQLLSHKQIFKVLHILSKAEINPEKHLMALAEESPVIEYRDFIVEQIIKLEKDMNEQNKEKYIQFRRHWNLLRYLEKSFEKEGTFKQNKVFKTGKERIVVTESEIKALTIEKIIEYHQKWKCTIATSLFFDYFDFELLELATSFEVWNYLLDNNKAMILVRWINIQMSEVVRDMNARYIFFNNDNFVKKLLNVDTKGFSQEIVNQLDNKFREWAITEQMIECVSMSSCFVYTKMCIYDTLCSYGIVSIEESKSLYTIIARLARTQNLKLIDDIFTETCATITKRDFYMELAQYCVKNKLYKVLAICVEGDLLGTDFSEVEQDSRECIELWLSFKSIEHTADRQSHVMPVYKTCQQIAKGNIDQYITANPYLVLGMLLLQDNAKIFQIFSTEEYLDFKDFKLPNKGYREKLPHLYEVFKKFSNPELYVEQDINMYQLLSGYRGLDIAKIFEFQLTNQNTKAIEEISDRHSIGSVLPNDTDTNSVNLKEFPHRTTGIPHFANEKLMKRYGYAAKLNHMYYLKQYRPCNASQAFVAQQYQMYNRLQDKSIKSACCEAHALALQNWDDPAMAACAVSFIAMIGCNPTRCRIHMAVGKIIKQHLIKNKTLPNDAANKVVCEYMSKLLQSSDIAAKEILSILEDIIMLKVKTDKGMSLASVLYESQIMVKFAMLHNLPLPTKLLLNYIKSNRWFEFILIGDVFRYPIHQMIQLTTEFNDRSLAEHMKHIMMYRNVDDVSDKEMKISTEKVQRRMSRLNSIEVSGPSPSPVYGGMFEFPEVAGLSGDLWEVVAACHGPEDPPGALVRAAGLYQEPLLALIATCYEPNALGVVWAYWVLASLGECVREDLRESLQWDISQQHPTDNEFQSVAEICLQAGYARTLHESMLVFFPESPLAMLSAFLCRCIWQRTFDDETTKLLRTFTQHINRKYSVDNCMPWVIPKQTLQRIAVSLLKIALASCFDSGLHQREFLNCLVDAQFSNDLLVPCPDFTMIHEILKISMETSSAVSVAKILQDGENNSKEYLSQCVQNYTKDGNYHVALKIATLSHLPVNEILMAEWTQKYEILQKREERELDDKERSLFIAQCSEAFKKASVTCDEAVDFLLKYVTQITNHMQRFYSYRVVLIWFVEHLEYGRKREEVEHLMWSAYFQCETQSEIFLNNYPSTMHYILNEQKDQNLSKKVGLLYSEKPYCQVLSEIEIESDLANIEDIREIEDPETIEIWRKVTYNLLEHKMMVEAFRLSVLYKLPLEFRYRTSPCPVQIVKTCFKLAEGLCSPYELPQELRLVIAAPMLQNRLSLSETSDNSFEELVVIPERQEPQTDHGTQVAAREDADRLAALEALAARSALTVAKQVSNYFRIALQIGWNYNSVLTYKSNPMEFINFVSGRARMSLANLVFRTYNIPSKQIAEYLCQEMVSAVISPHLVKTSSFRQKEHFQYTLWGYALNADIEMFLNMRPDACSHIGRLILDHLMAFRKIYKCSDTTKVSEDVTDDSLLDVDTLIDEEYQTVDEGEVMSLSNKSATTDTGTILSSDSVSTYTVTTIQYAGNKLSRESRRNLFDVISRNNVHIRYEIKSNIRRITKGAKLSSKQVNIICIELLVLAHECFSCACDTEGVAVVLRSAQALTTQLQAARSWRLLVRLLTGLGRYTEMAYVFQILRDNHQFEFLLGQFDYVLGQQQDKITEFKQGLLDFLKNHCPGDTDTYIMVALHFNMHTEAANVKKKQCLDLITDLESAARTVGKKPSENEWLMIHDNVSNRSLLETALNHCMDASESYLQGGCMGFAGEMAALAQQIALQISLLTASPTRLILKRSQQQMFKLVTDYLSFMEGLVLMSSMGGHSGSAQWRELSYRRALTNDQAYLRDMAAYRPDIALEILDRYGLSIYLHLCQFKG